MKKKGLSPLEISLALNKKKSSLIELAKENQLADNALVDTLHEPYPEREKIIAEKIGMPVEEIWPSRYKR